MLPRRARFPGLLLTFVTDARVVGLCFRTLSGLASPPVGTRHHEQERGKEAHAEQNQDDAHDPGE